MSEKIKCAICGGEVHSIQLHLRGEHPDTTLAEYQAKFPGEPIMSKMALDKLNEVTAAQKVKDAVTGSTEAVPVSEATGSEVRELMVPGAVVKRPLNEVFDLGKVKSAFGSEGKPIMISTVHNPLNAEFIPEKDNGYVFDIDNLKNILLGLELNIPTYVWGHAGTGKTTLLEQVASRTNRPLLRVQHTVNTEESHIIGQWVVKDGATKFQYGPLPMAMINGWIYCADEYDFALPPVLSVYQPVLEGKSLVIKEAPEEQRVIRPHPNFRFVATGNTNGSGDETGLYQGTNIQNAANYDRFGICVQQLYMKKPMESQILQNQASLTKEDADKLVDFAGLVREAYDGSKICSTVSPRALINAARIGVRRASFRIGLELAFINKLSKVDRVVVAGLAQRIFG